MGATKMAVKCPDCGKRIYEKQTDQKQECDECGAAFLTKTAKAIGHGAHIMVPREWTGKEVVVHLKGGD